eukprot:1149862-Pelagomonas_calceolata.AAC.8
MMTAISKPLNQFCANTASLVFGIINSELLDVYDTARWPSGFTLSARERAQAHAKELAHLLLCSPSSHPNTAKHVLGRMGQEGTKYEYRRHQAAQTSWASPKFRQNW